MKSSLISLALLCTLSTLAHDSYWFEKGERYGKTLSDALTNPTADSDKDLEVEELFAAVFEAEDYTTPEYQETYAHFKELLKGAQQGLSTTIPEQFDDDGIEAAAFTSLNALLKTFATSFITSSNPLEAVLYIRSYVHVIDVIKDKLEGAVPLINKHNQRREEVKQKAKEIMQYARANNKLLYFIVGAATGGFLIGLLSLTK